MLELILSSYLFLKLVFSARNLDNYDLTDL